MAYSFLHLAPQFVRAGRDPTSILPHSGEEGAFRSFRCRTKNVATTANCSLPLQGGEIEWGSADSAYLMSAQNPNLDRLAEPNATDDMKCRPPDTGPTSRAAERTSRVTPPAATTTRCCA